MTKISQIGVDVDKIPRRTTSNMSVYVDSAATGTGDGTSWTDAFTTIQSAINSLPTVLEHAVTIYVRKGASAYAENISVQQIVGKGSLTLRGEYYWAGECAAAATPSTTKFNLTATDGAQIAAGDSVLIRDGYADYVISTVKATVDKGSNVWEIELNDALPTGNIATGDYYTICKTVISPASGIGIQITNTKMSVLGLNFTGGSSYHILALSKSDVAVGYCILNSNVTYSMYAAWSTLTYYGCYSTSQYGIAGIYHAVLNGYGSGNLEGSAVVNSAAVNGYNINVTFKSVGNCRYQILKHTSGTGVAADRLSYIVLTYVTIMTGTVTGIKASNNSVAVRSVVTNYATTPLSPASSTDNPVII